MKNVSCRDQQRLVLKDSPFKQIAPVDPIINLPACNPDRHLIGIDRHQHDRIAPAVTDDDGITVTSQEQASHHLGDKFLPGLPAIGRCQQREQRMIIGRLARPIR